jgi:hypothetical protein
VLVELHLDDVVEAAIDAGKPFMHFFAKTADFGTDLADIFAEFGDFSSDILAFALDEARKLVELGLLLFWHAESIARGPPGARRRLLLGGGLTGGGYN